MKRMQSLLFCLLLLSILAGLGAQTDEWIADAGGTLSDYGWRVAVDAAGNSYMCGTFRGSADFGATTLVSAGGDDIFVAKLDADGNWLWAKQAGGPGIDSCNDIDVDSNANVYITGSFNNTAWFGSSTITTTGESDIYVAKLDTNGNWLWANLGGGSSFDGSNSITTDDEGNIYITGHFTLTAMIGSTPLTSSGAEDVFVAKLQTNGAWLWATRAGGTGDDAGYGIITDNLNWLYVAGNFTGTAGFGTTSMTSAGNTDIFVCRLSLDGYFSWAVQAGGTSLDSALNIAMDGNGLIYLAGYFYDEAEFLGSTITSVGSADIFVAQLDQFGAWNWAVRGGGVEYDTANGLDVDEDGFVFITGRFQNAGHFGPTTLYSFGSNEAFIAKLDHNGNYLWARRAGGSDNDYGYGVAAMDDGGCINIGGYRGTAYINSTQLISEGEYDIYVARINDPTPREPQNISISNLGYDVIVDWDAVTQDTWGYSIIPDYYFIYYNTDGATEPYQYLTYIPGTLTEYVHQHAGYFSSNHFYQVTAVKYYLADRSGLDDYLNANLRQGMTKEEVSRALKEIR